MSVELPFAPVDTIIRRHAGDLRVSADAAEELARRIQRRGASLARDAAERAADDGRKTLMAADFGVTEVPDADALALPVAPIDRIARLDLDARFRVSKDARVALADLLETYAADAADGAAVLAEHAGRRTVQAEDVQTYFDLVE
ncbi:MULTISPECIES: histone family protein [Halobacterium]|uniref:histone family protein n=1 Tax=Halobacterium TaxID=2239 RepID=UPI00073E9E7F|nr:MULTISPECIES: histone [Halobacterium]MCG1002091.1 NFYB/HAP3 family transcription factor subunit [Halobacterium noricense]